MSQPSEIVTLSLLNAAGAAEQPADAAVELLPVEQASALSPVGVAFRLSSSEPQALASGMVEQPLQVHIDYAQLAEAYGGSFAERLTLYRLTPCAEENAEPCQNWQALPGTNDPQAQRLTVDLSASVEAAGWSPQPLPPEEGAAPPPLEDPTQSQRSYLPLIAGGTEATVEEEIYVLAAAASSQQGSYKATPLSNVGDYQVSLATGAFQTGYPIALPPAAGGLAPGVALNYDSGGVDGMTTNKNNQPGWVGLGWSLESGYITRHLKTCGVSQAPGDLCLVGGYTSTGDAYSIVLGGVASRLVQVSGTLYRLQNDPQWKVEKFSDGPADHPDAQKEYWLVTTPDGTKYRFGGEFTPANEGGQDQNSVFYATVYNTNAAVCGSFSYDLCNKAWRWNLDRVEDTNGNVVSYFYELEQLLCGAQRQPHALSQGVCAGRQPEPHGIWPAGGGEQHAADAGALQHRGALRGRVRLADELSRHAGRPDVRSERQLQPECADLLESQTAGGDHDAGVRPGCEQLAQREPLRPGLQLPGAAQRRAGRRQREKAVAEQHHPTAGRRQRRTAGDELWLHHAGQPLGSQCSRRVAADHAATQPAHDAVGRGGERELRPVAPLSGRRQLHPLPV